MQTNDILFPVLVGKLTNGRATGPSQSYALRTQHYLHDRHLSVMFMGLLLLYDYTLYLYYCLNVVPNKMNTAYKGAQGYR